MESIKNTKKFKILLILLGISIFVYAFFPTLARYKNRTSYYEISEWDGSVATKYNSGTGTEIDPYIISNGSEFAYFQSQLEHTDYKGVYFKLGNDIVLNKGIFSYDGTISYQVDDSIYEIEEYTTNYSEGNINEFPKIKDFKGNLDGNLYRIYGLYMTSNTENDLALFDNLSGNISNLYITNSLIYGGNNTAMLSVDTSDATINNVMIDGYVIGSNENMTTTFDITELVDNKINLSNFSYQGNYVSSKLTGEFTSTENNKLVINGTEYENGKFEISLNKNTQELSFSLLTEDEYQLNNLKYVVVSDYGVSSSFAISSNNTNLNNVVNKAYISAKNYSSGFIHTTSGTLTFKNGYNTGEIKSNVTSGLINYINSGNVVIDSFYNNKDLTSSFIYNVSSGDVTISNSFTASTSYVIDTVESNVTITNSYAINSDTIKNGEVTGGFTSKDINSLKNSNFMKETLLFNEFVSINDTLVNNTNIWVFENERYPILYIDDLNRPVAKINVSIYSWDTLANDLDTHKFSTNFMFNINTTDALAEVKSIEYYLHKSMTPLENYKTVEYTKYESEKTINEEGSYIIYAKITDSNDNITYINSDILIVNPENTIANITISNYKYSSVTTVPKTIYLSKTDNIVVNVNEEYVNKDNISYYVTSELLTENNLKELSEVWTQYVDKVEVSSNENNIYYFKIVDNNGNENYISTDYITVDGYVMNEMMVGRTNVNTGVNITSKSSIAFNYSYIDSNLIIDGYTHNIVSSILLPEKTEITLIDNETNKVYKYKTTTDNYGYNTNNKATYPFNLFKEIGSIETKSLNENIYLGEISEDFKVIIDFKNTTIDKDYNDVKILLEVNDSEGNKVIPTLESNIKTFNIKNEKTRLQVTSNFTGYIDYNKDNSNIIDFDIKPKNTSLNDSNLQDKKYGLELKMIDVDNTTIMDKTYLSNIQFKYNDKVYNPYSNGTVHFNLEDQTTGNIVIDTFVNNNKLEGNYAFYICPYSSYDGINYDNVEITECVSIPINIVDNYNVDYKFDIVIQGNDRIFMKNQDKTLNFEMLYQSEIENPNVRVSLYEKNELTAYNQTYSLVDLQDYLYTELEPTENKTYYLDKEITSSGNYELYSLSFKNSLFNLNGYKLVFDLYDGDNKVGSMEKKFIVKGDE